MTSRKSILIILFLLSACSVYSQSILDEYVQEGLDNNLALKQIEFSYEKSVAALKEAQGSFLPSVDINARYTRADGGRTIEFPVGDLMNPVYTTLNQLTGQQLFPTIKNQEINFLREEEQDTKIEFVQPLFQPEIYYNYKIKSNLSQAEKAARNAYARSLICDIKSAYYNYMRAVRVLEIFESTEDLLNENLRVSKSLYENNKVTIDVVYRAETELAKLRQQTEEALSNEKTAKAYFNFLLNRGQEMEIVTHSVIQSYAGIDITLEEAVKAALRKREEIQQIGFAGQAADDNVSLNKSKFLPSLVFAAGYGFQGDEYKFTSEDDYWTASLVFKWNLFRGFQDHLRIEQSELDKKNLELKKLELENQISLQVRKAYYDLEVAQRSIEAAELQERTANKSFEIVHKKFGAGMSSQIEFIDARSTLTNARLNNVITQYREMISIAELEKAIAADPTAYSMKEVEL